MKKEDLKIGYYICKSCIPLVKNQDGIDSIEDCHLKKAERSKNTDSDSDVRDPEVEKEEETAEDEDGDN